MAKTEPRTEQDQTTAKSADPGTRRISVDQRIRQVRAREEEARQGGGPAAVEKQHDKGKLTARERIDMLLDPGSFEETDMLARHRVTGFGMEDKRP
jgi:propionyl-CoA carboxylase beta chain